MPFYEYKCKKCEGVFQILQKVDEKPPKCILKKEGKTCEGETKKIVSKTSFILKGGGWFKDGY